MPKRKSKKNPNKEDLLDIDPSQKPTWEQALWVAGAMQMMQSAANLSVRQREVCRVGAGWILSLALQLKEEAGMSNGL